MPNETLEFDPSFNCPTHFASGDPTCPACIAKQPQNLYSQFIPAEQIVAELRAALTTAQQETELLRGVVWALADAFARRQLSDANAAREEPNNWPAGQEWAELVGSSHSIFRRLAYEEAGIDRASVVSLLCDECGNARPFIVPAPPTTGDTA